MNLGTGISHSVRELVEVVGRVLGRELRVIQDTVRVRPERSEVMELRAESPIEQRQSYLQMMHKAVRRGSEIVSRLRQYLKDGSSEVGVVNLKQVLEETVELAVPLLQTSNRNVKLVREMEAVGNIRGNAADLRRTFTNLIINALQAMPAGGELALRLERANDGTLARVTIADTGSGIPYNQQKKIFYPYFTTKPQGTGLGLSIVRQIIDLHGGTINIGPGANGGVRVILTLKAPGGGSHE